MINRLTFRRLLKAKPMRNFSQLSQSQQSFNDFHKIIADKKSNMEDLFGDFATRLKERQEEKACYTNPLDHEHNRVNFGPYETDVVFLDVIGPEQVSPHYENFAMTRKYAFFIFGSLFSMSILSGTNDISWIMESTFVPFAFYAFMFYYFYEGKKFSFM